MHIYGLINKLQKLRLTEEQPEEFSIFFDAVYQVNSASPETKFQNTLNAADQLHFDLSQVLIDMQFSPSKKQDDKDSGF